MNLIAQGAEAKIFLADNAIIKERIRKKYRIQKIDKELRKFRTKREAKILEKLQHDSFPSPKFISMCDKKMRIKMEFIKGELLKNKISQNPEKFGTEIGRLVGLLHNKNIIHYDLTTSNMILNDERIHLIDFGLSFFSEKEEDKAVDLHLLDRVLYSKHSQIYEECMNAVIEGYKETCKDANVIKRLEKVKLRGRNKQK